MWTITCVPFSIKVYQISNELSIILEGFLTGAKQSVYCYLGHPLSEKKLKLHNLPHFSKENTKEVNLKRKQAQMCAEGCEGAFLYTFSLIVFPFTKN